ncbi:MBL fold metallo-hydrolase [Priestia megaterium]|uniref:MBL fold metallo-hydrolase n=1 Tax=Priestia megaterium TaxID=1404 RepID=A0A3D8WWU8_PRIMG|nr:MBL fold metallo-hydrolase [Priestia megaterium]MDD9791818.1 MBL fold metallo-hydrolase [Priestia megaterium]MDH3168918.1 MBL fold metallo-hydrolase [Priestia megaterium]RDZ10386.1 MBL fold metallo-hydrolase [Priestia megaterium]
MEFVQISEHVYRLTYETVVGIRVKINTWYVVDGEDVYIIDTGMEDYACAQLNAAKSLGAPKSILLTHGHLDHINGAKYLRNNLNIPIYAHENEIPFINAEKPYPNRIEKEITGVEHQVESLNDYIIKTLPLDVYLTPGHAPGHVIYHHKADNVLLTGDLFFSNAESLHPPIRKFTVDMDENINSGRIIDEIKPSIISSSHGEDVKYNDDLYTIYKFIYE